MFGLHIIAVSGLLKLAGADQVQCAFNSAPVISVTPVSAPVQYDFSKSAAELTSMRSDTVNPYAPGTDTITEGLRADAPVIATKVSEQVMTYPGLGVFCMNYDKIDVDIELHPTIYIASENGAGVCQDAIIEHEKKHVRVDREIMNEFAQRIGVAVQQAVNEIGAMGPVNVSQRDETGNYMTKHIESAVESQQLPLYKEMRERQGQVDSLEEYQRVDAICGRRARR